MPRVQDSWPLLLPLVTERRPATGDVATLLGKMADWLGGDCPHEWFMHLPPRRELPADLERFTFPMVLPLTLTCRHCLARFTLERDADGEIRMHGRREGEEGAYAG